MSDSPRQSDPGDPAGRYARQIAYRHMGPDAQRRLAQARVVLIGCGALGGMQANILVRAGVGRLQIVDRDVCELDNLQRQVLFDEADVAAGAAKAEAAQRKLLAINSDVRIEAAVVEVDRGNIERLVQGANLLLDGTDNFRTRFLINDVAVKHAIPWVHGGVVADHGSVLPIFPGITPCLRCVFSDPAALDDVETCQQVGVLASAVAVVASLQAVAALKILAGHLYPPAAELLTVDVWTGRIDAVPAGPARRRPDCLCCGARRFEFLEDTSAR
jgi:molybdopterin/thiamine biosynthesis adenylyltransferase